MEPAEYARPSSVRTRAKIRDVKPLRYATDGFHCWSPDEVREFEARHTIGTKARLAFALMLYLGARRRDVVTLGRQHVPPIVRLGRPGQPCIQRGNR